MINLIPVVNTSGNKVFINTFYIWQVQLLEEGTGENLIFRWVITLGSNTYHSPDFVTMEGAAFWFQKKLGGT